MKFRFRPDGRAVLVPVRLLGPSGPWDLRLALDTGATTTLISAAVLIELGYDPASTPQRHAIITGSGIAYVPKLSVRRIEALGCERTNFPVLAHTLPPSAMLDGLLGLDFMRDKRLTIDFRKGEVSLT